MFEAMKNGSELSEKKLPLTNKNKKQRKKVDSELRFSTCDEANKINATF